MNIPRLKAFAPAARRRLLEDVANRALRLGVHRDGKVEPATVQGDLAIIAGFAFPRAALAERDALVAKIKELGFDAAMEQAATRGLTNLLRAGCRRPPGARRRLFS